MGIIEKLLNIGKAIGSMATPLSEHQFSNWIPYDIAAIGMRIGRPVQWEIHTELQGALVCFEKPDETTVSIKCESVPSHVSLSDAHKRTKEQCVSYGERITYEDERPLNDEDNTPSFRLDSLHEGHAIARTVFIYRTWMISVIGITTPAKFLIYQPVFNNFVNSIRFTSQREAASQSPTPSCDVFISYQNKQVEIARCLSEQLIAANKSPWFAEYIIALHDWEKFQQAIVDGISRCKAGVVLFSKEYADSEWCLRELNTLIRRHVKVIVIELTTDTEKGDTSEDVRQCLRGLHVHKCRTLDEALACICRELHWEGIRLPRESNAPDLKYYDPIIAFGLTLPGWQLEMHIPQPGGIGDGIPVFSRMLGTRRISMNLITGIVTDAAHVKKTTIVDEKQYYAWMLKNARLYSDGQSYKALGAHLCYAAGHSHFAFTYQDSACLMRKYSVDLPGVGTHPSYEFAFTFAFDGSFREFCRYAYMCDAVVSTSSWHPDKAQWERIMVGQARTPKGL